jgi:hypothetical protein
VFSCSVESTSLLRIYVYRIGLMLTPQYNGSVNHSRWKKVADFVGCGDGTGCLIVYLHPLTECSLLPPTGNVQLDCMKGVPSTTLTDAINSNNIWLQPNVDGTV